MTPLQTLLNEFRQLATSNRDLGDKFERLFANYLIIDPQYSDKYSDVWLWSEWPDRHGSDTGIDLVAKERYTGDYCAIQCKFYDPASQLQKSQIDSFFTELGKKFPTLEGEKTFTNGLIVSTTDKWSKHAETALENQQIPITRISVSDLENSPIDWARFSLNKPQDIKLKPKKTLRPHQQTASDNVIAGFQTANRGKLIMACGTGKTFTALKIAEQLVSESGLILFLVPSISLLSQTLREWTTEASTPLHCLAVCSDKKVGKSSDSEDISVHDLAFPATTNYHDLSKQINAACNKRTVIFSTYQSIQVIADAQLQGLPIIDLIICDEAHRTTGVTLKGDSDSHFVKVHNEDFIKGKKRLYMTATPRIFNDSTKTQAQDNEAVLCSMDDENLFGEVFHRLGFSQALDAQILCDYKVMVLAVDEKYVTRTFQAQIADNENEITLTDAAKITGCWNGLSKRGAMTDLGDDTAPMRRAVAFAGKIKDSEKIAKLFSSVIAEYAKNHDTEADFLQCEVEHVDGTMNALQRNQKLDWLKADTQGNTCRILSNARCLSEGVDVPALDAVLFLNPRDSVVDVVQSVGRVMRKAVGKQYGYVILPITIPADMPPEEALKDNKRYKVVWQVLQALRAHDDRFNATVNKIALNKKLPGDIQIIGVGGGNNDEKEKESVDTEVKEQVQLSLPFKLFDEWRDAIYAKIVAKCGERDYWEKWAKEIAVIAERHIDRINVLLGSKEERHQQAFGHFLTGLQAHLNPSISQADAVEMLAQHLITKPVFDALFEGYAFTQHNPVSLAMQTMLDVLEDQAFGKETQTLEKFYDRVRQKASGIDNAAGKQKIIIELYEKFFKNAFPRMAERLGIVYTPVEVVDFIIHSADDALRQEFGVGLTDENVHILDPFTGTGTFMVRLLQSSLIKAEDLARKYAHELHANEIILLAYYIAAINIEETYHDLAGGDYSPFQGIVLTDTFQLAECKNALADLMSVENGERANLQMQSDIRVIMGNPPYSSSQSDAGDNNQNLKYEQLDERISSSYIKSSFKKDGKSKAYDSYIRAIRWASDRIKDKGIICYVTNGAFIDNNAMDGLRKCLTDEFSRIYCFNLRGNQRTSGETSRLEGGKIFDSGSRATIAITLLIKNPEHQGDYELFYHDIGDYLNRDEKLKVISNFKSINGISWQKLTPNENYDWINHRNAEFESFIELGNKGDKTKETLFNMYSMGVKTNRDDWVFNFSKVYLEKTVSGMIDFYNKQVDDYAKYKLDERPKIEKFISTNPRSIKWTEDVIKDVVKLKKHSYDEKSLRETVRRPFCKQWLYYNKSFNWTHHLIPQVFPDNNSHNFIIYITGTGITKDFNVLMIDTLPDFQLQANGQGFPLYTYEKIDIEESQLFDTPAECGYRKKENITDVILNDFRKHYHDAKINKEDIFYYVYGVLHSSEYKQRFASDLKKMLPRIPFVQDFLAFSRAGRDLAQWHINYETIEPYKLKEFGNLDPDYKVHKMTFAKNGKEADKTAIIYNSYITLSGIPLETYEYIVNGKPALEWIMERYQITKDKDSGITNNPNDWSDDPRYIIDLVKRIVRVSVETVKIVNALPALNEQK